MILMPMGDHESLHLRRVILQVRDVRDDKIDAEHIILRECQTAVHDNDAVIVLERRDVHTDLFESAQRYDTQFSIVLFFQ